MNSMNPNLEGIYTCHADDFLQPPISTSYRILTLKRKLGYWIIFLFKIKFKISFEKYFRSQLNIETILYLSNFASNMINFFKMRQKEKSLKNSQIKNFFQESRAFWLLSTITRHRASPPRSRVTDSSTRCRVGPTDRQPLSLIGSKTKPTWISWRTRIWWAWRMWFEFEDRKIERERVVWKVCFWEQWDEITRLTFQNVLGPPFIGLWDYHALNLWELANCL